MGAPVGPSTRAPAMAGGGLSLRIPPHGRARGAPQRVFQVDRQKVKIPGGVMTKRSVDVRPMTFVKPAFSISRREILPRGATAPARGNLWYADELRALGQALETQDLVSFDLQAQGGDYLVRGWARSPRQPRRDLLGRIGERVASALRRKSGAPNQVSEVVYQFPPERIRQLHREGRNRRVDGNQTPNPCRLSQVLRSAGCYLDGKSGVSLSRIAVEDRWVTLSCVTAAGRVEQSKTGRDFLYDHWVRMCLRRRDPTTAALPYGRPPLVALH